LTRLSQKKTRRALTRSQLLRTTSPHSPLSPTFYHTISQNLKQSFSEGLYLKDGPPPAKKSVTAKDGKQESSDEPEFPKAPSMFTDPGQMDAMMGQFKTQTVVMIPQMVIMGWVNFFFSGFVASEFTFIFLCCSPLLIGVNN
jgi:hypothetical protein